MKNRLLTQSEHDIQSVCIQWLNYNGFYAWRANAGMVRTADRYGKYRMIKLGDAGMPDVLAIVKPFGFLYGFEIKRPGGKVTEIQRMKHEKLAQAGAKVFVIHSLEELKKAVEREIVLPTLSERKTS